MLMLNDSSKLMSKATHLFVSTENFHVLKVKVVKLMMSLITIV